jgi:DNA polymerase III delta subunit
VRNVRVWGKRQAALERAARRLKEAEVLPLLSKLAKLDALAKGLGDGDPWDALVDVALALCARTPHPSHLPPRRGEEGERQRGG